ncbi:MAG TPA: hypothetical protein VHM19_08000 [Polyangiales bacterium]|jgi:hypothetical protein|nr:hypothetical protein [Polyangiales bacterium]
MCQRVQCKQCGKPTYAGCGAHVEQVLGDVPRDQRCRCREQAASDDKRSASWIDRLLGR